jgi:hypothetical protein
MIVLALLSLVAAIALARLLIARYGTWNAILAGGGAFVVMVAAVQLVLPGINEVPEHFSAAVLWQFRVAALGLQAVLWTTIGVLFGTLTERSVRAQRRLVRVAMSAR